MLVTIQHEKYHCSNGRISKVKVNRYDLRLSPLFHKSHDHVPLDENDAGRCIEGFDGRPHLHER